MAEYVVWCQDLGKGDVERVGGKNASLGEMISNLAAAGVSVPGGFATTAEAFRDFLEHNDLTTKINDALGALDVEDVVALAETGEKIRKWVVDAPFQPELEAAIRDAYAKLGGGDGEVALSGGRGRHSDSGCRLQEPTPCHASFAFLHRSCPSCAAQCHQANAVSGR